MNIGIQFGMCLFNVKASIRLVLDEVSYKEAQKDVDSKGKGLGM